MKRTFLPIAILLFIISCRKEPVPAENVQPAVDTSGWHKSDPGIGAVHNFYFLTPAKGFAAGGSGIYHTLDSGKTWANVDATLKGGRDIFSTISNMVM